MSHKINFFVAARKRRRVSFVYMTRVNNPIIAGDTDRKWCVCVCVNFLLYIHTFTRVYRMGARTYLWTVRLTWYLCVCVCLVYRKKSVRSVCCCFHLYICLFIHMNIPKCTYTCIRSNITWRGSCRQIANIQIYIKWQGHKFY